MNLPSLNSIYAKCILSIGSIMMILVTLLGVISYLDEKASLYATHEDELSQLKTRLNINLPGLIWNYEDAQLALVLEAEGTLKSVAKIVVFNKDGSQLAESPGTQSDTSIEVKLSYGEQEQFVGTAKVYTDESDIDHALKASFYSIIIQDLVLLVVLIVSFQFIIRRYVSKPLGTTVQAFKRISSGDGDLTLRLDEVSNDEIGFLAKEFNVFVEKIQVLVQSLNQAVVESNEIAHGFSEEASSSNQLLSGQQSEIDMVATAITEMSHSAREIVLHVQQTVEATDIVNTDTNDVSRVVTDSIDSITTLNQKLSVAADSIKQLAGKVEDIHSVLDVIVGIAEQTNLLALNAAIEAARAGEQGRGFAVVADEVRALASRTKSGTSEIQKTIESLQQGTRETVFAIEDSQSNCKASVELVSSSGESIASIKESSSKISNMAAQIESAVSEQSRVSESLNDNINEILDTGNQSIQKLEVMFDKSQSLNVSTKTLEKMINQFTF